MSESVPSLVSGVQAGRLSAEALTERALGVIERAGPLNAFLHVDGEGARAAARGLDERRVRGDELGPLAGIPIAVKDSLCTQGMPTTAASRSLTRDGSARSGWRPPYDATVVSRLRAAGAVIVAKTNQDELAMGSSSENSAFGAVKNPWDLARTPGGSSGGSAAAVACRATPLALGSDTGGSIRQPAALCGVVGIKPTYGRVSRYGLIAFGSSLDQVGPLATDVRSAARLLGVLSGHDPLDSTSATVPVDDYEAACERGARGLRIGVPREYFASGLSPEVERAVRAGLDALRDAGATLVDVELPHTRYGVATYYVLATAEASSNLARLDGVRFGLRVEAERGSLDSLYGASRSAGFGREVQRRILLGTFVLSSGYYDAYYAKAQQVRALVARDFERAFARVDAIAAPTSPTVAFRLGERLTDPLAMYLADVYTLPASLAGLPALSVPAGLSTATDADPALPVGLQLIGPAFAEASLLALAACVEAACPPSTPEPWA